MPATIIATWIVDRECAMEQSPHRPGHRALRRGRVSLANHAYLVTTTTCSRIPYFRDFDAGCAASRCFETNVVLRESRLLTWVLMPDHVHWLIQLGDRDELSDTVNRLKSASARRVNRVLGRTGAIWDRAFQDRALRTEERLTDVARYIVANPVRAGIVRNAREYPFWNAIWL